MGVAGQMNDIIRLADTLSDVGRECLAEVCLDQGQPVRLSEAGKTLFRFFGIADQSNNTATPVFMAVGIQEEVCQETSEHAGCTAEEKGLPFEGFPILHLLQQCFQLLLIGRNFVVMHGHTPYFSQVSVGR